jgi:uncharacterized protein YoxC
MRTVLYIINIIYDMDDLSNTINNLNDNMEELNKNYNGLIKKVYTEDNIVEKLSNLQDIKEIIWILNEKILKVNDSIEMNSISISEESLERIKNNKIVINVLKPYMPYILANLCCYNT